MAYIDIMRSADHPTTGHCRRRKIRCLAAPDDHQGRCANCIRLKKECTFFPVEQQPPVERRPRAGSRMDGRGSTSSDSSPALNGGHIFNQLEPFSNFNTMPFSNNPDYPPASASLSAGVVSPMTRGKACYIILQSCRADLMASIRK